MALGSTIQMVRNADRSVSIDEVRFYHPTVSRLRIERAAIFLGLTVKQLRNILK